MFLEYRSAELIQRLGAAIYHARLVSTTKNCNTIHETTLNDAKNILYFVLFRVIWWIALALPLIRYFRSNDSDP